MRGRCLDARDGLAQIIERAPTSRARDVFRFGLSQAAGLQDGESRFVTSLLRSHQQDAVRKAVDHHHTHVRRGFDLEVFAVRIAVLLADDDRVGESRIAHFVDQCAEFARAVRVVRLRNDHHFRVRAQTSLHLLIELHVREEEELDRRRIAGHKHQILRCESRVGAFLSVPGGRIHDGRIGVLSPMFRQLHAVVGVVGSRFAVGRCGGAGQCGVGLIGNHHRAMFSADVAHGTSGTARRMKPIERHARHTRNVVVPRTGADDVRGQFVCYRNFGFGRLGERNTYGIADAVGQEGTDAHRTFDAAVLTFAGLRHTQMQGEVHFLAAHGVYQQAHALYHHHRVRGLDRNHHVVKMHLGANTQKFHATLHDARRCVAVAAHDAVRQAAVVHPDAHSRAVGATNVEQLHKAIFQARQFGGIFLVGVF